MSTPIEITSVADWNTALRSATAEGRTVICDFHAAWCGPCKAIAPKYTALAKEFSHVKFLRVDVDNMKAIAAKYQVSAMPTFIAVKAGKVVETLKGADPNGLARLVQQHAGPNPPIAPLAPIAEAAKVAGNAVFAANQFEDAIKHYSEALSAAPESFTLYSNRSLAYLRLATPNAALALVDAESATSLSPFWAKGWVRKGDALVALERYQDAVVSFQEAVAVGEGKVRTEASSKLEDARTRLAKQ